MATTPPENPLAIKTILKQFYQILDQHFFKFFLIFLLAASPVSVIYIISANTPFQYIPPYIAFSIKTMPFLYIFMLFATTLIIPTITQNQPSPNLTKVIITFARGFLYLVAIFTMFLILYYLSSKALYFSLDIAMKINNNGFGMLGIIFLIIYAILIIIITSFLFLTFTSSIIKKTPPITSIKNTYNLVKNFNQEIFSLFIGIVVITFTTIFIIGYFTKNIISNNNFHAIIILAPLLLPILFSILSIIIHTNLTAQKTTKETKEILDNFD